LIKILSNFQYRQQRLILLISLLKSLLTNQPIEKDKKVLWDWID